LAYRREHEGHEENGGHEVKKPLHESDAHLDVFILNFVTFFIFVSFVFSAMESSWSRSKQPLFWSGSRLI